MYNSYLLMMFVLIIKDLAYLDFFFINLIEKYLDFKNLT
jgi:hypothetical protein